MRSDAGAGNLQTRLLRLHRNRVRPRRSWTRQVDQAQTRAASGRGDVSDEPVGSTPRRPSGPDSDDRLEASTEEPRSASDNAAEARASQRAHAPDREE